MGASIGFPYSIPIEEVNTLNALQIFKKYATSKQREHIEDLRYLLIYKENGAGN
ncbi:MAG: hypothetical protein ACTSWY_05110 [Promethearchaeota archaeon]